MIKFVGLVLLVSYGFISGQTVVKQVFLKGNKEYMINVIQEVMNTLEQREWSSITLPDFKYELNSNFVFDRNYTGTVTYKNGFLVSVQHLSILQSSLQQIWNVTNHEVKVHVSGQLRMIGVTVGYDIEADLVDGVRHYTGQYTHPLLFFDFWVIKTLVTREIETKVFGNMQAPPGESTIDILPKNTESDDLMAMFDVSATRDGFISWTNILHPIFDELVDRIPFPEMCYNCRL